MKLDIKINGNIPVDLDINDIISEINELSLGERWSIIARILNEINLSDIDQLSNSQIVIIRDFLNRQNKIYHEKNLRKS